jgi:transcriptional regulator with XRE-family HTH domain
MISLRLAAALEGRSVTDVAEQADLARSTLYDLAGGRTWPDLISLGKLESALDIELLPPLPERDGVA